VHTKQSLYNYTHSHTSQYDEGVYTHQPITRSHAAASAPVETIAIIDAGELADATKQCRDVVRTSLHPLLPLPPPLHCRCCAQMMMLLLMMYFVLLLECAPVENTAIIDAGELANTAEQCRDVVRPSLHPLVPLALLQMLRAHDDDGCCC
jgi:hypothetical protein